MDNLKDLYIDLLQDLWSANSQCLKVTQELAEAATDDELRSTLDNGLQEIEGHNDNLESLIDGYGASPKGEHCKGMEGLVKEARAHALDSDFGDDATRDAMIIAQQQRLTHYGIAGYGTCLAIARKLGLDDDASVLESDLDVIYRADEATTRIAEQSVNAEAIA